MIFVILGSQKFQFNRLLEKIDELVCNEIIKDKVFAQIGYSDYKPKSYSYKDFLDRDEFAEKIVNSNIVITHCGTGAIVGALKKSKKVIAVPRLSKYGEHVDDHQAEILKQFTQMNLFCGCENVDGLAEAIKEVQENQYVKYVSNTDVIIKSIEMFLMNIPPNQ